MTCVISPNAHISMADGGNEQMQCGGGYLSQQSTPHQDQSNWMCNRQKAPAIRHAIISFPLFSSLPSLWIFTVRHYINAVGYISCALHFIDNSQRKRPNRMPMLCVSKQNTVSCCAEKQANKERCVVCERIFGRRRYRKFVSINSNRINV